MNHPLPADWIITGFPRCGTTALLRNLAAQPVVRAATPYAGRSPQGHRQFTAETPWLLPKRVSGPPPYKAGRLNGHKYSSYLYRPPPLKRAYRANPETLFIVCVRDPIDALKSWHIMHGDIARRGSPAKHFAVKDAAFYGSCSIEDYYERWAASRLNYTVRLEEFLDALPDARRLFVAQPALAVDTQGAVGRILALLGRSDAFRPPAEATSTSTRAKSSPHAKTPLALDPAIARTLSDEASRLRAFLARRPASELFVGDRWLTAG